MNLFLTPKQLEILKLRHDGKTQREIAMLLGTTRENVSIVEKRARENVRKAKKTLDAYERIMAVEINLRGINDVVKIPKAVFKEADAISIKVAHSATDILELIESHIEEHGRAPEKAFVLKSGTIVFE